MDCVFCAIVAGAAPSHRVYEDDETLAFLDIRPLSVGHTLVVPKQHAADLAELSPELAGRTFAAAQRIARAMRRPPFAADGVNVVLNDGRAAMQTVPHVHFHALPRRHGDVLRLGRQILLRRPGDLATVAERLRASLAALDV